MVNKRLIRFFLSGCWGLCGCPILILTRHHEFERVVWHWPLQRPSLVLRRAHPLVALFVGCQDQLDQGVRRGPSGSCRPAGPAPASTWYRDHR
jgi:hypothetical protein